MPSPDHATPADLAACRLMLRHGSRTFFAASLLLPARVREPAGALYAFCRQADDAIDLEGGRQEALGPMRERLALVYAGRPLPVPVDRALADVLHRHRIPRLLPEALFEGFEWDAQARRYETIEDLHAYAVRVAGTVGAMMAMLMGVRSAETVARACDLGVAMQLSNIARDVGEDARAGRLYLPLGWLREAGIEPEAWLARPRFSPALGAVTARLLDAAELFYARADAGIAGLPAGCRPGIRAARHLYAGIGHEVRRRGCDSVAARAVLPRARKAALLARALAPAGRGDASAPPLLAARHLVEAVAEAPAIAPGHPWWRVGERATWVIDLFERLERRDRVAGGA